MSLLPTNYQNEILNSAMSNRRQYRLIENDNGTYSFIDVTVYDQEGSLFSADDVNSITTQVNLNVTDLKSIHSVIDIGVVNGIKGDAESNYRVGNVSISPADIGTLTESQIRALISGVSGINFVLVDELPTTDISTSTIYLVPSASSTRKNLKDEYIYIVMSSYEDITSSVDIETDYSSLPTTGTVDIYYITSDDSKIYTWDDTNSEYVESTDLTVIFTDTLPSEGTSNTLYVLTTDNTVSLWVTSNDWELIGSTSVDLTNYYTKTELDNNVLITISEFENM